MSARRPVTGPLALVAAATAAAFLLWRLSAALPLPSGLGRDQVSQWVQQEGAATATFALARVVGLALALYTTVVSVLGVVAAVTRAASLRHLVLWITLPALRPVVAPVVAATLTLAAAMPAGAQGRGDPSPRPPIMQIVDASSTAPDLPVMTVASALPRESLSTHTVAPGDTFWSIAEDALRLSGSQATDSEIVPYWRALIEANRDRLKARDEPDLIYPGQVFVLPPIS